MAVVSLLSNYQDNADGLRIFMPTSDATVARGGEYMVANGGHMTEVFIDLVTMCAAAAHGSGNQVLVDETVSIPNGALIEKVELMVTEVTAGSSATLDVGLVDQDRSTEIDFDGLIVAGTTTWHTGAIGTTVTYSQGSTEHGALVGTVLTNTGLIVAEADTADYTDGVVRIRIFWSVPLAADL